MKKFILKISSFLFILLMCIVNVGKVNAENNISYTYDGEYSLDNLLRNYNLVTLGHNSDGNVIGTAHIVGPVLVKGNLRAKGEYNGISHSDVVNNVSSYVQGIDYRSSIGGPNQSMPPYYLGKDNVLQRNCEKNHFDCTWDSGDLYINESWTPYNKGEIIKDTESEMYLDFERLYNVVVDKQQDLDTGLKLTPEDGKIVISDAGSYTIENLNGVKLIDLNPYNRDEAYLITIPDNDTVYMPEIRIDGAVINTGNHRNDNDMSNEQYVGNVAFSLPNATKLSFEYRDQEGTVLPNNGGNPSAGHIIAPNAQVVFPSMNHAGTIIADSIDSNDGTEFHMYSYILEEKLPELLGGGTSNSNSNSNSNKNSNSNDKDVLGAEENPDTFDNSNIYKFTLLALGITITSLVIFMNKFNKIGEN